MKRVKAGTRTVDLRFGSVTPCQLSHSRILDEEAALVVRSNKYQCRLQHCGISAQIDFGISIQI